jgi:hypothetical protein
VSMIAFILWLLFTFTGLADWLPSTGPLFQCDPPVLGCPRFDQLFSLTP